MCVECKETSFRIFFTPYTHLNAFAFSLHSLSVFPRVHSYLSVFNLVGWIIMINIRYPIRWVIYQLQRWISTKQFCVCFNLLLSFSFSLFLCIGVFFFSESTTPVLQFSVFAIVKSSYFLFFNFFFSSQFFSSLSFVLSNFFVGRIIHFISVY